MALRRWLRLWFGFSDPIGRGTYLRHGLGLMVVEIAAPVDMFPQVYWTVPARAIVAAIHTRVLHHIQTLAEEKGNR